MERESVKDAKSAPGKLYYSISEVSELTGVKAYVLRFWEREFPTLKPKKNRSGNRIYQEKEIELVRHIKKFLYEDGFTIEGARHQLRNGRKNRMKLPEKNLKSSVTTIKSEIKALIKLLS